MKAHKMLFFTFLILSLTSTHISAQDQGHSCIQGLGMGNQQVWWTGSANGKYLMDFTGGSPVLSNTGIGQSGSFEGTAVYTTPDGDLLLYTDGSVIFNGQTHALIGSGVGGNPSATEAALIVPDPAGVPTNDFYVFGNTASTAGSINYSLVDISGNSIGAVTPLDPGLIFGESLAVVPDANGTDFWILSVTNGSPTLNAYLVSDSGVTDTPISSAIPALPGGTTANRGTIIYHPPTGQLAIGFFSAGTGTGFIYTAQFDESTGTASGFTQRAAGALGYGVAFSPDASKLYYSVGTEGYRGNITHLDIASSTATTIATGGWAMPRLGPDGKIYVVTYNSSVMGVINAPDNDFASINWNPNEVVLPSGSLSSYSIVNQTYAPCSVLNPDIPPVSVFTHSCTALDCSFDGTTSSDVDGFVAEWDWDFGDGSFGTGDVAPHTFPAAGTYTVALTVTDDDGLTNASGQQINVAVTPPDNIPPVSLFTYNCNYLDCSFDGSTSTDSDGVVTTWDWEFGDGNLGTGVTMDQSYAAAGTYVVILTVTDDDDATNASGREVNVTIPPPPDAASIPIPTVSVWALIMLSMLLGLTVFVNRRRLF
jgi:PKD repeat protein